MIGTLCNAAPLTITAQMTTTSVVVNKWEAQTIPLPTFDEGCIFDSDKNKYTITLLDNNNVIPSTAWSVIGNNIVVDPAKDETTRTEISTRFGTTSSVVIRFSSTLGGVTRTVDANPINYQVQTQ